MLRYFTSLVTGRPLEVGGRSFIFEPVTPRGGGWLGVLAVEDESAASILASFPDRVSEISEEQYDVFKKKRSGQATTPVSAQSPTPQPKPQPLVPSVVLAAPRTNSISTEVPAAVSESVETSVSLKVTDKEPPPEPLLDVAPKKKRGKK